MLRPRSFAVFLLVLLSPCTCVVTAQQIAEKTDPRQKANKKKAVDLLDTVASRISTLSSPENRMALSCVVGGLIWDQDEKRARALFESVTEDMTAVVARLDLSDQQSYNIVAAINRQRQEIVGRIARRDPELALAFLRPTRVTSLDSAMFGSSPERNLEFFLARMVAAKDPGRAVQLARESLAQGLSNELVGMLTDLQRKHNPAAQALYEAVVNRIKDEDLGRNQEAANFACNLLTTFSPPQANENAYRDLLDILIKTALSLSPSDPRSLLQAQNFYGSFRGAMPLIDKYAPARAPSLRQWSQGVARTFDPNSQMYNELNEIVQNGTVDDILALAPKYPAEMRNHIYQQAAWKAGGAGDAGRARQIANDLVSDPMRRRQMLEQLEAQSIWTAINEKKLAEARALLSKTTAHDQRVQMLMRLATLLVAKENKKGALECLNEARISLAASQRSSQMLWQHMQLAIAYSTLDLDQSFAIMQPIAGRLNELIGAAAVMDGFDDRYLKNGEWMPNGPNNLNNVVVTFRRTLAQLARLDFDRAQALADQLERPEIRLMAQVDLAQAVLSEETTNCGDCL